MQREPESTINAIQMSDFEYFFSFYEYMLTMNLILLSLVNEKKKNGTLK